MWGCQGFLVDEVLDDPVAWHLGCRDVRHRAQAQLPQDLSLKYREMLYIYICTYAYIAGSGSSAMFSDHNFNIQGRK